MNTEVVKVDLPLAASANAKAVAATCTSQSAIIKQAPGYSTTPAVQAAVADMDTAVGVLQGTLGKLDQLHVEVATLEKSRGAQVVVVRLKHDGVATALNTASNNDPQAAQAWVGKTKERAKPVAVSASTNPPADPALRCIKRQSGSVEASCTKEAGAVCYLFQQGTDPLHPETWAPPAMVKGNTHKVESLTIGQVICFRIAIVRRGSVQSQWSPVLQVVVR